MQKYYLLSICLFLASLQISFANVNNRAVVDTDGTRLLQDSRNLRRKSKFERIYSSSIYVQAYSRKSLSMFSYLLRKAGLAGKLGNGGEYTAFAPWNDAFKTVDTTLLTTYYNRDILNDILLYHLVSGSLTNETISETGDGNVNTLLDQDLSVDVQEGNIFLNSKATTPAKVVTADIEASNGVLNIINNVLIPDGLPFATIMVLLHEKGLNELENALKLAELVELVEAASYYGITLFAPNDKAFENFASSNNIEKKSSKELFTDAIRRKLGKSKLKQLLLYHTTSRFTDEDALRSKADRTCNRFSLYRSFCEYHRTLVTKQSPLGLRLHVEDKDLFVKYGKDYDSGSKVVQSNLRAMNGMVHVVNTVLEP